MSNFEYFLAVAIGFILLFVFATDILNKLITQNIII